MIKLGDLFSFNERVHPGIDSYLYRLFISDESEYIVADKQIHEYKLILNLIDNNSKYVNLTTDIFRELNV